MIQSIETLLAALATTTILSSALLFLPAIIELKKPKDAGPRFITDSFAQFRLSTLKIVLLNIEEELKFDVQLPSKIGRFLCFIPNLEA